MSLNAEDDDSLNGYGGGGLNDEPVIEDEQIFEAPVVAGEPPTLHEDVTLITSIHNQAMDLGYLAQSIAQQGGMSQQLALECEQLSPGTLGVPIGSFSSIPTATRYKVSLEAIGKGIWALVAAATAAVIAAIIKLYSWISGKKSGNGTAKDAEKSMEQEAKDIDDTADGLEKAAKAAQQAADIIKEEKPEVAVEDEAPAKTYLSLDELIEDAFLEQKHQRAKRFLETRDPILYDLIHQGPYYTAILNASKVVPLIVSALKEKLAGLREVVRLDQNAKTVTDQILNSNNVKALSKPIEVKFNGTTMSIDAFATHLSQTKATAASQETEERMSFDRLFDTMAKTYRTNPVGALFEQLQLALDTISEMDKELQALQKKTGKLSTDGFVDQASGELGSLIREAVLKTMEDIAAIAQVTHQAKGYAAKLRHMGNEAVGLGEEIARRVSFLLSKQGMQPPAAWAKVTKDLKELHRELMKNSKIRFVDEQMKGSF